MTPDTIPAKERAPFYILTALYLTVLASGFNLDAPLFAPSTLFIIGLVFIVLGHLVHVYRLGVLRQHYPRDLLAMDFVLVALLALMFNLLVHPIGAAVGNTVFSFSGGEEFLLYLQRTLGTPAPIAEIRDLAMVAFYRFFILAVPLLALLIAWHVVAEVRYHVTLSKQRFFYLPGWIIFGLIVITGIVVARKRALSESEWINIMDGLTALGLVAAGGAAASVILAFLLGIEYQNSPRSE